MTRLRIALVAGARYPIAEPFAGGMESHTWTMAAELTRRGHDVTVFAAPGSDPAIGRIVALDVGFTPSAVARADVSMPPEQFLQEHHAYQRLMLGLSRDPSFDVVHLNSVHHLPVAMAGLLPRPPVLTLHTPPTPWLESALRVGNAVRPVAVSEHTARAWEAVLGPVPVVRNGISLETWPAGQGGDCAVWSGRLVPEKGAHLAIEAARLAGMPLVLAGPAPDPTYLREQILLRLGHGVRWIGHLGHAALSRLIGSCAVGVVTPCWDEPFGLVVAETMATGTPVAGFARGALPEIVSPESAVLAAPGDVTGLARAMRSARHLDRQAVRGHAQRVFDRDVMVSSYEQLYLETTAASAAVGVQAAAIDLNASQVASSVS